jgi:AraC-like DNA-binding protein
MLTYSIGSDVRHAQRASVRDAMGEVFGHGWDVNPVGNSDLRMVIKSVQCGGMNLSQATLSQAEISNRAPANKDGDECPYNIYLSNRRHVLVTDGRKVILEPGDVTISHASAGLTMTTKEPYSTIGLTVPGKLLRTHIAEPEKVVGVRFSCKTGFSKIVSSMLFTMWEHADSDNFEEIGTKLGENLLSILSTCCDAYQYEPEAQNRDLLAKQEQIKHIINQNLKQPDLCVGELARQFGYSIRYIQRLFSEEDCTVSNYIRRQRLEGCRRHLADPAWLNHSITEIAFNWGFNSSAHFSRVFKEQYGINARDYRKQAMKGMSYYQH